MFDIKQQFVSLKLSKQQTHSKQRHFRIELRGYNLFLKTIIKEAGSMPYILIPTTSQWHVMLVKCEQHLDELTVQVWLPCHLWSPSKHLMQSNCVTIKIKLSNTCTRYPKTLIIWSQTKFYYLILIHTLNSVKLEVTAWSPQIQVINVWLFYANQAEISDTQTDGWIKGLTNDPDARCLQQTF